MASSAAAADVQDSGDNGGEYCDGSDDDVEQDILTIIL